MVGNRTLAEKRDLDGKCYMGKRAIGIVYLFPPITRPVPQNLRNPLYAFLNKCVLRNNDRIVNNVTMTKCVGV